MGEKYGEAQILGELDGEYVLEWEGWVFWFPKQQCYRIHND